MMRCKNIGSILWHKGSEPNSVKVGHNVTISQFSDIFLTYFLLNQLERRDADKENAYGETD